MHGCAILQHRQNIAIVHRPLLRDSGSIELHRFMLLNLGIGPCYPPVGAILFVGCAVGKVTIEQVMRKIWPFYVVMFLVLIFVTTFRRSCCCRGMCCGKIRADYRPLIFHREFLLAEESNFNQY
jgi:hypothetical protein